MPQIIAEKRIILKTVTNPRQAFQYLKSIYNYGGFTIYYTQFFKNYGILLNIKANCITTVI